MECPLLVVKIQIFNFGAMQLSIVGMITPEVVSMVNYTVCIRCQYCGVKITSMPKRPRILNISMLQQSDGVGVLIQEAGNEVQEFQFNNRCSSNVSIKFLSFVAKF